MIFCSNAALLSRACNVAKYSFGFAFYQAFWIRIKRSCTGDLHKFAYCRGGSSYAGLLHSS